MVFIISIERAHYKIINVVVVVVVCLCWALGGGDGGLGGLLFGE